MMRVPQQFAVLEDFVDDWDHPSTNERYAARLGADMTQLTSFRDAILPIADDIKAYLDDIPLNEFGPEDQCLGRLMFAFTIVASAVEIYRQPMVPDSGATEFHMVTEPELG